MAEPVALTPHYSTVSMTLTGEEPFFLVMNTSSGSRDPAEVQQHIAEVFGAGKRHYQLITVSGGQQLEAAARRALQLAQEHKGVVVAVGGDGTLNAVSQQVLGRGVPFGILPQGTFNYFGRRYGISQDTRAAASCLLDAVIEAVPVGLLNGHIFLVNASLGLYPELLEDREAYKQRYGRSRWVALWSAIVTLLHAHRKLTIQLEFEGQARTLRTHTLVIANNALQLRQIGVDEAAELERNHLVAISPRPVSSLALYGLLLRGLVSRLGEAENVMTFGFETMVVRTGTTRRTVKVAMDGEIFHMRPPLTFSVASQRLPLLVPRQTDAVTGEVA